MTWLLVGLAGAAGALTRYALSVLVGPRGFPWTTLAINVTGSFVLGAVLTAAMTGRVSPQLAVVIGTGFLGAYTTYSTFSWELVLLLRDGQWPRAAVYTLLSLVLGVGAAALGYRLGLTFRG